MFIVLDLHHRPMLVVSDSPTANEDDAHALAEKYAATHNLPPDEVVVTSYKPRTPAVKHATLGLPVKTEH